MDQAVRAPAIMQELISGTDTGAVPAATPRYQPGTIREIIEEETPARPVIEMSDDEMAEDVPVSHSVDSVDAMVELSGGSEEAEASSGATGRRGRRKKVPADLTFSSGRNRVGHCSGGQFSYSQVESPTTQSSSQSL